MMIIGCLVIDEDENGNIIIDLILCNGCGLCKNFCWYFVIEKVMVK